MARADIPPVVFCAWLENPVEIDGRMTSSYEWSEAVPIDITLGVNFGREPPFYRTSVWAKNDDTSLYLLYRIEYPFEERNDEDRASISYLWPEMSEDNMWPYSDSGSCSFGGQVRDTYRSIDQADTRWKLDTEFEPPGQNNVEGACTHDGIYYWFEMKKDLNSGDGYDWNLKLGERYPEHKGDFNIALMQRDPSGWTLCNSHIILEIAEPPFDWEEETQTGDGLTWSLEMTAMLITIVGGAGGLAGWVVNAQRQRKRRKVMFKDFLEEIDDVYTRFKMNSRQCEGELLRIKEQIMGEFRVDTIDSEMYGVLDKRIDDYLREIREEIRKYTESE